MRNVCLFHESCSNHVYRVVINESIAEGIKAFRKRFSECKTPYLIVKQGSETYMHLNTGRVLTKDEINPDLIMNRESNDT